MPRYVPGKGDFVILTFDPQAGREQRGRRPALVVSNTLFNRHTGPAMVCPITNTARDIPFHVPVPDASSLTGYVMVEQLKSVDWTSRKARFVEEAPAHLAGVSAVARESADTGRKIVALREEVRETLLMLDRSAANALRLHEQLFATPIIGVARAAECLGVGFAAANRLIDRMVDCGVLRELTGHRRNRRFAYQRYIDLFAD